ncbi:1,2-phenylacetyl-CoA epoxidase subunit PaaC [Psychroflexus halocasei]|uniref:Ring-1,2-phenylacetyl-CoA epoxidase subunit PaaC n=1 Tax=Psychroflexus halocasei TaxID=908615 RepID=A0A1H4ALT4_9FLAO|nr:1,2-phenylacetyl-CoA epoxidase subunit PaaC [Psychroflexus halocasei]SEA36900.1 ring-1,2-phenylacetyl-CoA epoxidase subunit PaaC [Psychroflexus halocasei]
MSSKQKDSSFSENMIKYIYGIADNSLILGQRLGELTGHGPTLEVDIAMTNISLDLFGQVRSYFQYAAQISDKDVTEDDLAFLRTEREYLNVLLVEQPNKDFAYSIGRQFLFDHFHFILMTELQNSKDETLVAIAKKTIKEVSYHKRFSSDWVKRLGDGTEKSHQKMQTAIDDLWKYTDELFHTTEADEKMIEAGVGVDVKKLKEQYYKNVSEVLEEATLQVPDLKYFQKGGKNGIHSEHMGFILTEMQYMQRTFPGMKW